LYFPVAEVTVNPIYLTLIGLIVGVLGGFFGVGGGFLAGPLMFLMGVPMNFAVGTDLAHIAGKSLVAAYRHRVMGQVDVKLGILMTAGTMAGVEAGANVVERLQVAHKADSVLSVIYVGLLFAIGVFMAWEGIRAVQAERSGSDGLSRVVARPACTINLPPMVSLPASGIERVSVWVVLCVGFVTGLLSGMLGVGGGFIRMPALIYLLGVPTHVAIGTDLFEIIFSAGYGTVSHALKGNVDVVMALVMHTGAALGAQIGAISTGYASGPKIRLSFAILPFVGSALVFCRLIGVW
jgi:uncharacterized membrane protein YfcA